MKLFAAALLLIAARSVAAGEESFTPRTVDFGALDVKTLDIVRDDLAKQGILAVANVPGLAAARAEALVAAAECVLTHGEAVAQHQVQLQDASTRASWAAYAKPGQREAVKPTSKCAQLDAKMEKLRDAVDQGASYFARLLDQAVLLPGSSLGLVQKADGGAYTTFETMVDGAAQHLDHFHVYEKKQTQAEDKPSLDLHTDHGLFIAIVPSVRVSSSSKLVNKEEDSFEIETAEGERVQVKLPLEGDVLLFMIGDGSNYIKRSAMVQGLRPVPHALSLRPNNGETRSVRAWFGRMFFAPSDAILNDAGETFASAIATVATARQLGQAFPTLGCASSSALKSEERRILHDPTGHNCAAGTAFCWMACRPMGDLTCNSHDALCISGKTNSVWIDCPDCHDPTAKLQCPPFPIITLAPTSRSDATVSSFIATGGAALAAVGALAAVLVA